MGSREPPSEKTARALARKGKAEVARLLKQDKHGTLNGKELCSGLEQTGQIFEELLNIHIHAGGT
jgi:hypothetical protein